MKLRAGTYENILAHYNRDYSPIVQCECGKYIPEKLKQKHLNTKLHEYLLDYKIRCGKLRQEQEQQQPITDC